VETAIQLFGSKKDGHIEAVTRHLLRGGHFFRLFDIFDPHSDGLSNDITERLKLSLFDRNNHDFIPKAVWWRIKPHFYVRDDNIEEYYNQQFAFREWLPIFDYLSDMFRGIYCINQRDADKRASNKIFQLEKAAQLGFRTPKSLFSNDPNAICQFIEDLGGTECIHKTLMPYISPSGRQKFTTIINKTIVREHMFEIGSCPSIYQEVVRPKYELRVTVVGNELFVARINKKERAMPDWRIEMFDDIYDKMDLSNRLTDKILKLHTELELVYAAYDFLVDDSEDLIFLEVNPGGQWLWLEQRLEMPISTAIAKRLAAAR
jgi:glutathione synthase/RimK-type ligase-like ATP-grasp enzyme